MPTVRWIHRDEIAKSLERFGLGSPRTIHRLHDRGLLARHPTIPGLYSAGHFERLRHHLEQEKPLDELRPVIEPKVAPPNTLARYSSKPSGGAPRPLLQAPQEDGEDYQLGSRRVTISINISAPLQDGQPGQRHRKWLPIYVDMPVALEIVGSTNPEHIRRAVREGRVRRMGWKYNRFDLYAL